MNEVVPSSVAVTAVAADAWSGAFCQGFGAGTCCCCVLS